MPPRPPPPQTNNKKRNAEAFMHGKNIHPAQQAPVIICRSETDVGEDDYKRESDSHWRVSLL